MEVGKFDHYHGYLSSESPTPNGLPKHLDIMVSKANGLRVGVFHYRLSLHNKLEQMGKVIYRFIGFSFSVCSIHSHSNLIQIFSEPTFLSLCISHVLMEKIFRFQLRHHTCLIKPTFLQLHHRTSLIKLLNITSLHHNYNTCSILTFHHSNITSHYLVFIHLQIHSDFQLPHLPSTFVSLTQRYVPYSISKLLLLPSDVKINPGLQPIDENSVFCSICSNKINRGVQQGMVTHLL